MNEIKWWYTDILTISLTSCFDYLDIMLRLSWHLLIWSDKTFFVCLDQNKQHRLPSSHLEKVEKKNFSFRKEIFFFQLFQSFQLDETKTIDNIFAFSIICFSVYTKSISILLVFVLVVLVLVLVVVLVFVLLSFTFSVRDWISSKNSKHCSRVHHLIWHNRLHLHAFESRELTQCKVFERLFFCSCSCSKSLHQSLRHFRINMMLHLLHVLCRSSSIFRFERTIARSYHLWFLYDKKRIQDFYRWRNNSFKSIKKS